MRIVKRLKQLISSIDMFYSSDLLRYDNDTQYKTVTGGLMTSAIIVVVIIGFFSMIIDTLNRTAITYTLTVNKSNNPTFYQLLPNQENMFMFGVQIQSTNLNITVDLATGPRYFDLVMSIYQSNYGVPGNVTNVPLVQCTDQHWQMMPSIVQKKDLYAYSSWLCPQIGQGLPLQGSYTSDVNLLTLITVAPCNNQTDPTRFCAPLEQIDALMAQYGNFYVTVNYINHVINPSETNYISYYLQGENYVIFSPTQGCQAWFAFSDYTIITDGSILPFTHYTTDVGAIVQNKAINHPFTASNVTGYVNVFFQKSSESLVYQRSVQKISAVFSYIGGLVGALTAVLFLLKSYTDASLQLSIAMSLFRQSKQDKDDQIVSQDKQSQIFSEKQKQKQKQQKEKEKPLEKQGFNFFTFVKLIAYKLFSQFQCSKSWKKAKLLSQFQKQIIQQLDIKTLLRRIISIQTCISCLLNEQQLEGLKYRRNVDLNKARQLREQLVPDNVQDLSRNKTQVSLFSNKVSNQPVNNQKMQDSNMLSPNLFVESIQGSQISSKNQNYIHQQQRNDERKNYSQNSQVGEPDIRSHISRKTETRLKMLREDAFKTNINQRIWKNLDEETKFHIQNNIIGRQKQPQPQITINRLIAPFRTQKTSQKPKKKIYFES